MNKTSSFFSTFPTSVDLICLKFHNCWSCNLDQLVCTRSSHSPNSFMHMLVKYVRPTDVMTHLRYLNWIELKSKYFFFLFGIKFVNEKHTEFEMKKSWLFCFDGNQNVRLSAKHSVWKKKHVSKLQNRSKAN